MHRLRVRLGLLGVASLVTYLSVVIRLSRGQVLLKWGFPQTDFIPFFLGHFALLFLLLLAGAWWTFGTEMEDRRVLGLILGFGILFRLLLLPTPPVLSSDVFRYIWDARVQASGKSPYLSTPADLAGEEAKQEPLYQQQNRPLAPTIYPPLAQLLFRVVRGVAGESVTAMKSMMVLADLCTLALLLYLLQILGLPRSRIILYAWHPLAVFEVAGSGHVDALAVPLILLAVICWQRGRDTVTGVALGAAALVKIYPILLVPAFHGRRRWQIPLACLATVAFCYLPLLPQAGLLVLGHLPRFLVDPDEIFNPSILGPLLLLGNSSGGATLFWLSWLGRATLLGVLLLLLGRQAEQPADLLARIWIVGAAMTLLTLTLHPWYLLWILPFLAIQPRAAWIYLSGAVSLSYLFYLVPTFARGVIGALEYLPFLLLLGWRRGGALADVPMSVRCGCE